MNIADWVLLANVAAVLVAAAAIAYSVRGLSEQFQMTTFLEYTKRYGQIMSKLHFAARQPHSDFRLAELSTDKRGDSLKTYSPK